MNLQILEAWAAKPFKMLLEPDLQEKTRVLVILACGSAVNNPEAFDDLKDLVKKQVLLYF
jgi:hypothetical protein